MPIDPLRPGLGLFSGAARPAARRRRSDQRADDGPDGPESVAGRHATAPQAERTQSDEPAAGSAEWSGLPGHILPLAEAVDRAASELEQAGTGRQLDAYRAAVSRFLDVALRDSARVSRETTPGLSQRVFACVTRCDLLLADLADSVLGRQRDNERVRRLTLQVKGLLVDLYR